MDREEAIKILKDTLYDENTPTDYLEAVKMGREALENQKIGHWIPVSDKLPNFNDIVLASTDSDYDELRVILTVYSGEEFWFNGKIIAWMPLPEPYKAESEDKK